MKTSHFLRVTAALAILLSACSVPLSNPGGAQGRMTISAGPAASRTLVPFGQTGLTYKLTLTGPLSAVVTDVNTTGVFVTGALTIGNWTAKIVALAGGLEVAAGTATQTVAANGSTALEVPMTWSPNSLSLGQSDVTIQVDTSASPVPVQSAEFVLRSDATSISTGSLSVNPTTRVVTWNAASVVAGSYSLDATFYSDTHKTMPVGRFHDVVLVFSQLGDYPVVVMQDTEFSAPGRPELVAVSGGSFLYQGYSTTVNAFAIGRYPVTQAQYKAVMGVNPSTYDNLTAANPEATWSPVETVSWLDAVKYCIRLSRAQGLDPVYTLSGDELTVTSDLTRNGYRLPTEIEYEYAARAGTSTAYYWGSVADSSGTYTISGNTGLSRTGTYGVGQRLPNAWGLYDMMGNVRELTNDWYSLGLPSISLNEYSGPLHTGTETIGRALRGGSYAFAYYDPVFANASRGAYAQSGSTWPDVGFRVVRRDAFSNSSAPSKTFDFEALNPGNLYGQDGWTTTQELFAGDVQVEASTVAPNLSRVLAYNRSGGGVGADASRPLNLSAPLNFSAAPYTLAFDVVSGYWNTVVSLAVDRDLDGKVVRDDSMLPEKALTIDISWISGVVLTLPDGTVAPAISPSPYHLYDEWAHFEATLQDDTVSIRAKSLTTGLWTTLFSQVPMGTSKTGTVLQNPANWNMLYLHFEAEGGRFDNVSFAPTTRNVALNAVPAHKLNPLGLYDGVGRLTHVAAANDASGGWLVSGSMGYLNAQYLIPQILFAKMLPNGAQDVNFGANGTGTVSPLGVRFLSLGGAAGFDQSPSSHLITLQAPYWNGTYRYNVLFQFNPDGTQAISANFPAGGGLQENVFLPDGGDEFASGATTLRNQFPVRDSTGNLYSLARRPEGGGDYVGVQQLHTDGSVTQGFWTAPNGQNFTNATSGIQGDNVLVAGQLGNTSVLLRLNTNGTEDSTFAGVGRLWFTELQMASIAGIRVDSSNRIYVAGLRHPIASNVDSVGVVYRLTSAGYLDSSFGSGTGCVALPLTFKVPRDLALQGDGKVIVVGQTTFNNAGPGFILRLLEDGSGIDTSFQDAGSALLNEGYGAAARSVAIDAGGRIGVAGSVNKSGYFAPPVNWDGTTNLAESFQTLPAFWVF